MGTKATCAVQSLFSSMNCFHIGCRSTSMHRYEFLRFWKEVKPMLASYLNSLGWINHGRQCSNIINALSLIRLTTSGQLLFCHFLDQSPACVFVRRKRIGFAEIQDSVTSVTPVDGSCQHS